MLMKDICLWCSLSGLYVDVTPGGVRSEGPQCLLSDSTHSPELQQRHLKHHEYSGCVQLGQHNFAEQPVWRVPRLNICDAIVDAQLCFEICKSFFYLWRERFFDHCIFLRFNNNFIMFHAVKPKNSWGFLCHLDICCRIYHRRKLKAGGQCSSPPGEGAEKLLSHSSLHATVCPGLSRSVLVGHGGHGILWPWLDSLCGS